MVTVGFVAYETDQHLPEDKRTWCAVVGYMPHYMESESGMIREIPSITEEAEAQYIAGWGAKLSVREAEAFFPELDITKYKYYGK